MTRIAGIIDHAYRYVVYVVYNIMVYAGVSLAELPDASMITP